MNSSSPVALDSQPTARRSVSFDRLPVLIAAAFLLLHVFLTATIDVTDPEVFLRADRAHERLQVLQGLLQVASASQFVHYLANHGIVGDYAVHAALYLAGGRFAVVFVQIALGILAGVAVYRLAVLLGLNRRMCAIAMTMYLCLPHTIVFPHQLVTEALQVPLFVISNWLLAEGLRKTQPQALCWSAAWLGAATLIRPVTLLWPIVAGAIVAIAKRPRDGAVYACIAILPVVMWMTFIATQTGDFGLGQSGHSMERNLYERAARIIATMPPAQRDTARATHLNESARTLGPVAYVRFAAAYPAPVTQHLLRDAAAFFAKSGIERVTLDYLAATPDARAVQDPKDGWRLQLELYGPVATTRYLWQALGPVLLASVAGAVAMLTLFVLAVLGALHSIRCWRNERSPEALTGLTMAAVVLYTLVFSQVLNAVQSRQRAPAEFAIVLLAVVGLCSWRTQRARRRMQKMTQSRLERRFQQRD